MPYKEINTIEKKYYTIGEVAKMLGITPSLIRFWEKKIPKLHPKKTTTGIRQYTRQDIIVIQKIHHLIRSQGYTVKGACTQMQQTIVQKSPQELIASLEKIKDYFLTLRKHL